MTDDTSGGDHHRPIPDGRDLDRDGTSGRDVGRVGTNGRDLDRVGGIGWLERTNGALTGAERRRLIRPILQGQARAMAGRLALVTGRRPAATTIPTPPDSAMTRVAEEAADDQPSAILGHARRTWAFGRALASVDATTVDEELFYVAALLHDVGLVSAVTGEDFTLRSAAVAEPIAAAHRDRTAGRLVADAISAHTTPGASIEADGVEAFYLQAGATCDLGGLRLHHLSAAAVDEILAAHPRAGLVDDLVPRIRAEAGAVPAGRFAVLRRVGFATAIRFAPLPH